MKFNTKYQIALWKAYFDTGYGVTSYVKYLIAFYGLSSLDPKTTLIAAVIYGFSCFLVGWLWYKYDWVVASNEVANKFNLFQREVREKLNDKKFK